jgi:hypothetical protein
LTKKLALMTIPSDIRKIWGEPPLLRNEDPETYEKLARQISQSVGPVDAIEWLWIKDILDLSWEIRRLRRFKTMLIELARAGSEQADQAYYETEPGETRLFMRNLEFWQRIDHLLAVAESRRAATLREIARRRASLAELLRNASSEIIEGECEEQVRIEGNSGEVP